MFLKHFCFVTMFCFVSSLKKSAHLHRDDASTKKLQSKESYQKQLNIDVLKNISRVNAILQDLVENYAKLKSIYKSHESVSRDYTSDGEMDEVYKQRHRNRAGTFDNPITTKDPYDLATEMFFSEEKNHDDRDDYSGPPNSSLEDEPAVKRGTNLNNSLEEEPIRRIRKKILYNSSVEDEPTIIRENNLNNSSLKDEHTMTKENVSNIDAAETEAESLNKYEESSSESESESIPKMDSDDTGKARIKQNTEVQSIELETIPKKRGFVRETELIEKSNSQENLKIWSTTKKSKIIFDSQELEKQNFETEKRIYALQKQNFPSMFFSSVEARQKIIRQTKEKIGSKTQIQSVVMNYSSSDDDSSSNESQLDIPIEVNRTTVNNSQTDTNKKSRFQIQTRPGLQKTTEYHLISQNKSTTGHRPLPEISTTDYHLISSHKSHARHRPPTEMSTTEYHHISRKKSPARHRTSPDISTTEYSKGLKQNNKHKPNKQQSQHTLSYIMISETSLPVHVTTRKRLRISNDDVKKAAQLSANINWEQAIPRADQSEKEIMEKQPRIFFKDQFLQKNKLSESQLTAIKQVARSRDELQWRRSKLNNKSKELDDHWNITEPFQTLLRDGYGDACLKVTVRKCWKACKASFASACLRYTCNSTFKDAFYAKAKSACITEFKPNGVSEESLLNIMRNNHMAVHRAHRGVQKKQLRSNASSIQPGHLQLNILRDRFEKECQKVSAEKCSKACETAVSEACVNLNCLDRKVNFFKKKCKRECKRSYRGKKYIGNRYDSKKSGSDSSRSDSRGSDTSGSVLPKKHSRSSSHSRSGSSRSSGSSGSSGSGSSSDSGSSSSESFETSTVKPTTKDETTVKDTEVIIIAEHKKLKRKRTVKKKHGKREDKRHGKEEEKKHDNAEDKKHGEADDKIHGEAEREGEKKKHTKRKHKLEQKSKKKKKDNNLD